MKQSPLSLLIGFLSFLNPFQKGFTRKEAVVYCSRRQGPTGIWERLPRLHYHLFNRGKVNLLKTDVELQLQKGDPSKKSIILITDDARAMVDQISLVELVKGLKSEFNVVVVYLHESPRNIMPWKDVLTVGPLDKGALGTVVVEEISFLQRLSEVECVLALPLECGEVLVEIWKLGLPILHHIPEFLVTLRQVEWIKKSSRDATLQLFSSLEIQEKTLALTGLKDSRRRRALGSGSAKNLADEIKELSVKAKDLLVAEREECALIKSAGFFDHCYAYPEIELTCDRPIRDYLAAWRSGWKPRKPCPGFHPGVYRDHHPDLMGDPTVDFIRQGKPIGPWLTEVMRERGSEPSLWEEARWTETKSQPQGSGTGRQGGGCHQSERIATSIRAALHLHLHYTEGIQGLLQKIKNAKSMPNLFISVTSEEGKKKLKLILSKYGLQAQEITVFPNRGRDIGPFLTGFGPRLFSDYEVVGHLHSKKSPHAHDDYLENWVEFLENGLVGEKGGMMDAILGRMATDPTIGIVYPDDPGCFGWEDNYSYGKQLLEKLGFEVPSQDSSMNFPVGTMFWARTAALKPLINLNLKRENYPEEPVAIDGTMLHAIERIFGMLPGLTGFRTVVTATEGISR